MKRQRTMSTIGTCLLGAWLAGMPADEAAAQDGCFGTPTVAYPAGDGPHSVAVGDLDGDGALDLAIANASSSDDVSVLLNQGDGTFGDDVRYAAGYGPWSVAVGDLDGDGALDLAVANSWSDDVSVLLRRTKSIEELIPWRYLKGVSTGDFHEALQAILGRDAPGLSATTIIR